MDEIWVSLNGIVENGEHYEVSNCGNVKSVKRYVKTKGDSLRTVPEKILKNSLNPNGYLKVELHNKTSKKQYYVHRLVALAFLKNDLDFPQINHIDGNKKNNHVSNLEYCSAKYNQIHAIENGLIKTDRKESHKNEMKSIVCFEYHSNNLVGYFDSINQACKALNLDSGSVSKVLHNKMKQTKGYTFIFNKGGE